MKKMIGLLFPAVGVAESQSGVGVTGEGGPLAFQRADAGGLGTEVFVEGNSTMHFTKGAVSLPPCP